MGKISDWGKTVIAQAAKPREHEPFYRAEDGSVVYPFREGGPAELPAPADDPVEPAEAPKSDLLSTLGLAKRTPENAAGAPTVAPAPVPGHAAIERQLQREQDKADVNRAGTGEIVGAAFKSESVLTPLTRMAEDGHYTVDFDFTPEVKEEYLKDRGEEINSWEFVDKDALNDSIAEARSQDHLEVILDRAARDNDNEKLLMEQGGRAIGARLAAAILDPVLLPTLLIPGVAPARLGRAARIGIGAAAGGAAAGGTEALIASKNSTRTAADVALATSFGLTLGGLAGGLSGLSKADRARYEQLTGGAVEQEIDSIVEGVTRSVPEGTIIRPIPEPNLDPVKSVSDARQALARRFYASDNLSADAKLASRADVDSLAKELGLSTKGNRSVVAGRIQSHLLERSEELSRAADRTDDSVGAARAPFYAQEEDFITPPRTAQTVDETIGIGGDDVEFTGGFLGEAKVIGELRGIVLSGSQRVRKLGMALIEGPILKGKGKARRHSAALEADTLQRTTINQFYRDTDGLFLDYSARRGHGRLSAEIRPAVRAEFYQQVGRALRGATDVADEAKQAAAKVREGLDRQYARMVDAGIVEKAPLEDYFPRMYRHDKVLKLHADVGDTGIMRWFEGSLKSRYPDMDDVLAEKIARAYTRAVSRRAAGFEEGMRHGVALDDIEKMREIFADVDPSLIDDIANQLENLKKARNPDAGLPSYLKKRLRLDENFELDFEGNAGRRKVKLDDMTETDAEKVLQQYFKKTSGRIGLARQTGITSDAQWEQQLRSVDQEVLEGRITDADAKRAKESLRSVYDQLLHRPTAANPNPSGDVAQASRTMAAINYIVSSGSFGLAQLTELGMLIGKTGIVRFIREVPGFRKMLKRAKDGRIENEYADSMDMFLAAGTDWARNPALTNFDELGMAADNGGWIARGLRRIDPALAGTKRIATIMNLMGPINAGLQRMAAMQHHNVMYRLATGAEKLDGAFARTTRARLADMGLDDAMLERVFAGVRKHTDVDAKGNVKRFNHEAFYRADREAHDALQLSSVREMRRIVQENDIGNGFGFANNPFGGLFVQFQNFMINSVVKQMAHGVKHRDIQAFSGLMWSSFIGGSVTAFRTATNPNLDEKEKEFRLSPSGLIAGGVGRTGFAAMYTAPIDTLLNFAPGVDPVFTNIRTSGLTAGIYSLDANPTTQNLNNVSNAVKGLLQLPEEEYQWSQENVKEISRILPMRNALGIKQALGALSQLPDEEESKQ